MEAKKKSILIDQETHRALKLQAAVHGMGIADYVRTLTEKGKTDSTYKEKLAKEATTTTTTKKA